MVSTNIITVNLSLETEIEKAQRLGSLNPLEEARPFPTRGFKTIETNQLVEEEELPDHRADRFYPARPGEIFQKRYQIVAKLGFGTSSTTWLARDLK